MRDESELRYFSADPGWRLLDVRELWRYRELLFVFAARELKVRYRQAAIGVAWVVLQPLAMLVIFSVFFGLLRRDPTSGRIPYGASAFCGLVLWQFVAGAIRDGASSLVQHRELVTKTYFPRLLLPASTVVWGLVDLSIASAILLLLLPFYGVAPRWTILAAPLFVLLAMMVALGAAVWLSGLNALYRDIGYTVPFVLQVGFFVSPVVYETKELIPAAWRWVYALNPLVASIEGLRWAVLGTELPSLPTMGVSLAAASVLLISGLWHFRTAEQWVADRI